jgi:hypothetical protein
MMVVPPVLLGILNQHVLSGSLSFCRAPRSRMNWCVLL